MTQTINDYRSSQQELISKSNMDLDGKLSGFLLSAEETSKGMVQSCKVEITKELARHKSTVTAQQSRLQSDFDTLKNNTPTRDSEVVPPKWSDLEKISDCCKKANETATNEINSLKQRFQVSAFPSPGGAHSAASAGDANELTWERDTQTQQPQQQQPEHLTPPPEIQATKKKLVLLTDSNGKRLDKKKFCRPIPLKEVHWQICYTLNDITSALDGLRELEIETLVICCGTNDIDTKTGVAVANQLTDIIHRIKLEHPLTKIVLSETTPRKYRRDDEIIKCNETLHQQLDRTPNVFIAEQSGLRDAAWSHYEDDKHILRDHINIYAGNIKSAMRESRMKRDPNSKHKDAPKRTLHSGTSTSMSNSSSTPSTNNYVIAPPLMSLTANPPPQHSSNNYHLQYQQQLQQPRQQHHRPTSPHNLSQGPRMSSTVGGPVRGIAPIGDRLLHLSQTQHHQQHQSKVDHLRDTLTSKFSDILKCLQAW